MPAAKDLRQLDDDLWTLEGDPISFWTFPYALRATIVRLGDGRLWVHSPVQLTPERQAAVVALGPVAHLVSPNKLHHLHLADWVRAYPGARLHAPPGLARKRRDLVFHGELGDEPHPDWADTLFQCVVRGSLFMEEAVFFHRASRTLLLGDLIENHDPAGLSSIHRTIGRWNRMLAPNGETPVNFRWSFRDRSRARAGVQRMLSWRPERVVLMHGPCVEKDAEAFLERAFGWLLAQGRESLRRSRA